MYYRDMKRFLKPGWIIVYSILLLLLVRWYRMMFATFIVEQEYTIQQWDTFSAFTKDMTSIQQFRIKWYLRNNPNALDVLQLWSYHFAGRYTPSSFVAVINDGPKRSFEKITILEWWSIYDTDALLAKKWLIQAGEYIDEVRPLGMGMIWGAPTPKDFFYTIFDSNRDNSIDQNDPIVSRLGTMSLEWFLYPDTYHIDSNGDVIQQLIDLQLRAFYDKVWKPYGSQIESFSIAIRSQGFSFDVSPYEFLILASIIEKEERNALNKPTIAWIFLNRIANDMRIDADITLCYGLHQWYESCTPSLIARSLSDTSNLYNTRVHKWLTPTPIASPSRETIQSLLQFKKTDYLFYLHDMQGQIWYASDLQWHNINKSKYL